MPHTDRRSAACRPAPKPAPRLRIGLAAGGLVLLGAAVVIGTAWRLTAAPQPPGPAVWVVDGMQRVGRDAPAGDQQHIELRAARGEYEPFQIVVRAPPGGLSNVDVAASDLRGPGDAVIGKEHLTLYREHYIRAANGSPSWRLAAPLPAGAPQRNGPLGPGLYAEALIPFADPATGRDLVGARLDAAPFSLRGSKTQPIWVDIFVPRAAAPGAYTGRLRVTSAQGAASVSVTLRVWNFELPTRPSLASNFDFWNDTSEAAARELVRHRLMPRGFPPAWLERLGPAGVSVADVGFWTGLDYDECQKTAPSMPAAPPASEVRRRVQQIGSRVRAYAFFADEIEDCRTIPGLAAQVRRYARALQKGGATPLQSSYPSDEYWIDGPYIWALLPVAFEHEPGIARARAAGQEIWSYNALSQDNYSPKWLLDYPPINFRIQPGFISQSMGLTGLYYWAVDYWVEGNEWNDVSAYGPEYPGEGVLTYPGDWVGIDGVAPGMRLKWLREGVEDYEYVALLTSKGEGAFAQRVIGPVAASFKRWTKSTDALYAARKRLGDRLEELASE